jgi:hypothetical protein
MLEQALIENVNQLFRSLLQFANTKGEKASQRLTLIVNWDSKMPSEAPMTRGRSSLWRLERQRAKAASTQKQIDGGF